MSTRYDAPRSCAGALAGSVGGLVGSAAMTAFLAALRRVARERRRVRYPQHSLFRGTRSSTWTEQAPGGRDDATVRAVARLYRRATGRRLSRRGRRWAGPVAHYAFGAVVGALYGAAAERAPRVARGGGLPFGTAVWLAADEIGNPALGLSEPPWRNPWPVHAWALGAHFVYGGATEACRRALRALMA
jgi:putative membrane protein